MVDQVNSIIYNTLITERVVTLPGVGTLSVVRQAATIAKDNLVAAPTYVVEFSSHAPGSSVVDIIAVEGGVELSEAEEIYARWLDKVRSGSVLTIEGVGTLRDKSFVADAAFIALFNPSTKSVKVKRKGRRGVVLMVIFVVLLAAIVAVGWLLGDERDDRFKCACSADKSVESTSGVEPKANVEADVVDIVEEPVEAEPAQVVTTEDAQDMAEEADEDWTAQRNIRHWVIAGSYSTEENAARAIKQIEAAHPDVRCKTFELGWMLAVAVYGSDDRAECEQFMRDYNDEFSQMWIHTPNQYR